MNLAKVALAAALGFSATAMINTAASAGVVCNEDGDCWHTSTVYEYRPEWGLTVHPDDWRWKSDEHYTWREHEGRGYWHGGSWVEF